MLIGSVLITAAGFYLLYRAYNIGVKKEITTKDNPRLPSENIRDPEGYCKFLSRVFNFLGVITLGVGIVAFLDDSHVIKLGHYIWAVFGGLLALVIICSIILNKFLDKYY